MRLTSLYPRRVGESKVIRRLDREEGNLSHATETQITPLLLHTVVT